MIISNFLITKYLTYALLVFLFFHGLEILFLRKFLLKNSGFGIWTQDILKKDFENQNFAKDTDKKLSNSILKSVYLLMQKDSFFVFLVFLRLWIILFTIFYLNPWSFLFIFLSSILINLRFRGIFNGGSDYLAIMIQWVCLIGLFYPDTLFSKIGLLYLAVQVIYSYFIAGYIKIIKPTWRQGLALPALLNNSILNSGLSFSRFLKKHRRFSQIITFTFLIFEISFPIIIWRPELGIYFLAFGFIFHMLNFILLGLNRFSQMWTVSYLAVWYLLTFAIQSN